MGSIKGMEVNIRLANIADILATDLGKGDSFIVGGRKNIPNVIEGYQNAIGVYNQIVATGSKYLDMAKALGDDGMTARLTKTIKNAQDMIKVSNAAINKLKSI